MEFIGSNPELVQHLWSTVCVYTHLLISLGDMVNGGWTLIESWMIDNNPSFQQGLMVNNPINQDQPNWNFYRLGLTRFNELYAVSTQMRGTCNGDTTMTNDYFI